MIEDEYRGDIKRRSMTPDPKERASNNSHIVESPFREDKYDEKLQHSYIAANCKDENCNYCCKDTVTEDNLGNYMEKAAQQKALHDKALRMGRV